MATLHELLHPQVIFDDITNRIMVPNDTLQKFFGIQMGGPSVKRISGRVGSYDIFDAVREVGNASMPLAPATRISAAPIASQPVHLLRKHEAIPLYYDHLFHLRPLGKPSSNVDQGGQQYIMEQEMRLKQRFAAFGEFMAASLIRGNVYFNASGDQLTPTFTSGTNTLTINQQIPASHGSQVGGIIGISWDNTAAATVWQDVVDIDANSQSETGWPIKHIWCNSVVWGHVTANSDMRARAGSSNVTFERFSGMGETGGPGKAAVEKIGILRPLPDIMWHIHDGVVELNGTATKLIPDTLASFWPEMPNSSVVQCIEGTFPCVENEAQPAVERESPYFWPWYHRDPARIELVGESWTMSVLRVPKATYNATVVF